MLEEESEHAQHGVSVSQSPAPITGHMFGSSLPQSPSQPSITSPHPAQHRGRSGSVPCRRATHDQLRSSLRRRPGRGASTQRQATTRHYTSSLTTLSIPRITVDNHRTQDTDDDANERPERRDLDDPRTVLRPRRQTVSGGLAATDRFPSFVLPSNKTLSLSVDLTSARLVYSSGEFIRLLLQRTDVSSDVDDDDAPVSDPPL